MKKSIEIPPNVIKKLNEAVINKRSRKAVYDAIGVSSITFERIERNKRCSEDTLNKILEFLKISR